MAPEDVPLFEHFLASERLSVRREALCGLIFRDGPTEYEADALSLFYFGDRLEERLDIDRFDEVDHAFPHAGLSFLMLLKKKGSPIAERILLTLYKSKRLRESYRELGEICDGEDNL